MRGKRKNRALSRLIYGHQNEVDGSCYPEYNPMDSIRTMDTVRSALQSHANHYSGKHQVGQQKSNSTRETTRKPIELGEFKA